MPRPDAAPPRAQLSAHCDREKLKEHFEKTVELWATAPPLWTSSPYRIAGAERTVQPAAVGTLALRVYQEVERLAEGAAPLAYLRSHQEDVVAMLMRWAEDEGAPATGTPQVLLEQDATEQGLAEMSRFLRETVPAHVRRFGWCYLSLSGPFEAALAMRAAQPDAKVSIIVAPHSDLVANIDQHVWRPRAVAASREASSLVLVVGNRNMPYTHACLEAALPRCMEASVNRAHVTLVNGLDVSANQPTWAAPILAELNGRVERYRSMTAMAAQQRRELDEVRIRTVLVHRASFLALLDEAEETPTGRIALQKDPAANTGVTELLGFLTCAALEAEIELVRDLEARAARQRTACAELEAFDEVALAELTAFTVTARYRDGMPHKATIDVQNIRDTLMRNHGNGLATRVRAALDAVWGADANAAALAELRDKQAEQRTALEANPRLTVGEALKPLKEHFLDHACTQWQTLVDTLVATTAAALEPTCAVAPAAASALAAEAKALLNGEARYPRACVKTQLFEAHHMKAALFLRMPKPKPSDGSVPVVNEEKLERMERMLTTGKSAVASPPSRVQVFDVLCEHLMNHFEAALGSHKPSAVAKQVFETVVADVLEETFKAAHAQRGASIRAAEARRQCHTSVNEFMEQQLKDFTQLCLKFREERPAREKYLGWELLRRTARRQQPVAAVPAPAHVPAPAPVLAAAAPVLHLAAAPAGHVEAQGSAKRRRNSQH